MSFRASMFGIATLTIACSTGDGSVTSHSFDSARLDSAVVAIAERARPGLLGVAVRDLDSRETWSLSGTQRFPMQSVFKLPLGAFVLHAVSRGNLSLSDSIRLTSADLSPPYSPIAAAFPRRTTYTVEGLLIAAAGASDNTAADVLMQRAGGPAAVSTWLASHEIRDLRIDRYEREFQIELNAMPPFQPAWAAESIFLARLNEVPAEQRRAATLRYLEDPRDTSTPLGAVDFLEKLERGELLPDSLTALLLRIATETSTGPRRIKAALADDARLAHKTGSARPDLGMNPAINDIGIITLVDGRRIAIAIFLSASRLPYAESETLLADVARAVKHTLSEQSSDR
jgi:beta-lactamase class A